MTEGRHTGFGAFTLPFAMRRAKQRKRLESQKSVEVPDDEDPTDKTNADATESGESEGNRKKKKKRSLVRKLTLGRFRVSGERHRREGAGNVPPIESSLAPSQLVERENSRGEPQEHHHHHHHHEQQQQQQQPQQQQQQQYQQQQCVTSTVLVVERELPSPTIGREQEQQLVTCSVANLPQPELNPQVELERKLLLLEQRRAFYQRRGNDRPPSSPDTLSDSDSPGNSTETVVTQPRARGRQARHISVLKFDTFSTFEGTFDEDTGVGYLAGLEEIPVPKEEKDSEEPAAGMPITEPRQDSTTSQNSSAVIATTSEKREHLYKILVIGELGAGKTSIIKRYVHQFFSQHYRATIGVDFALKVLNWDPQTIIRLQLWDIAGQERFGNMTRVYYKEAVGAFIVFDVTRSATLDAVIKWKQDLDSKVQLPDGSPIPCVLLANKCDQQKEGLVNSSNKMDEYCKENNFAGWFETSAKENINIEEAAKFLVNKILQNDQTMRGSSSQEQLDGERFALNQSPTNSKKSCAC